MGTLWVRGGSGGIHTYRGPSFVGPDLGPRPIVVSRDAIFTPGEAALPPVLPRRGPDPRRAEGIVVPRAGVGPRSRDGRALAGHRPPRAALRPAHAGGLRGPPRGRPAVPGRGAVEHHRRDLREARGDLPAAEQHHQAGPDSLLRMHHPLQLAGASRRRPRGADARRGPLHRLPGRLDHLRERSRLRCILRGRLSGRGTTW
jgi:hypothetical protein